MTDTGLFGLELRRARERRGLSLDQLAEATKVSGALFAGLERGDLSRWPSGIFRRAFVRSYAQAVGLDPQETLARFLRLFPDADGAGAVASLSGSVPDADAPETGAPRLVLDAAAVPRSQGAWRAARRIGAPLLDLLLAGIPAVVASLVFGWRWFFPAAAVIGLVGHTLTLALMGLTPGAWLLLPRAPDAKRLANDDGQSRRRVETETTAAPRRRQPRHASSSTTRPLPTSRTRRVQH